MARTDPQTYVRIPRPLKAKLETAARENQRSLNGEIIARLESTFEEGERRPFAWAKSKGASELEKRVARIEEHLGWKPKGSKS